MKTTSKIAIFFILLVPLFIQSCTSNEAVLNDNTDRIEFADFKGFPNPIFLNLTFGLPHSDSKKLLLENTFKTDNKTVYTRPSDSTSLVLNPEDNLTEFKIYLKSVFYLQHNQDLFQLLSEQSIKTVGSFQFSEMAFETTTCVFNLTYFTTNDFIRIRFQLKSKQFG